MHEVVAARERWGKGEAESAKESKETVESE